ncbi:MAG: hypothetical protein ACE5FO_02170, partial [Parvularculaceae bacterium]
MYFWDAFERCGARAALRTESGESVSYAALAATADRLARRFGAGKRLVLIATDNSVDALTAYFAALRARHSVMLCDGENARLFDKVIRDYAP